MMQKFYLLFFVILCSLGFGQSVQLYNPVNNAIYGNEENFCSAQKFSLKVDADSSSTGDYAITSAQSGDFPLSAGANPIIFQALGSNKFSKKIDINFPFSFYGKMYNKVVAGSNGRLVFSNNPQMENLYDNIIYTDRTFNQSPNISKLPSKDYNKVFFNNPNSELNLAQIFSGYTNLVPQSQLPSVGYFYKEVTHEDKKGLLISFQNQTTLDYSSSFNSSVLLLEDGRIIIFVSNKRRQNYNAILGIQNEDATKFKVPSHASPLTSDYNNGEWVDEGKAWVFTPNQSLTPRFKWTRNNIDLLVNANTLIDFVPNDNDVLKVEVTYVEDPSIIATDQIIFNKIKTPIIEGTLACVYDMKVTAATFDPALRYTWYRVGQTSPVASGQNLSIHRTDGIIGDYYVKITNTDGSPICAGSDESNRLTFKNQKFPGFIAKEFCLLDNTSNPPPMKTINLYEKFYPKYDPTSGLAPYYIVFYTNAGPVSDADAANFVVPANKELNFGFAVKDTPTSQGCHTGGLSLVYLSMPPTKTISLCSSVLTYDLKSVFQNPTYPMTYYYYYMYEDGTMADGNAIDVTKKVIVSTSAVGLLNCKTTTVVNFVIGATVTLPVVDRQERCAGSDTISNRFDFNLIKSTLDPTNQYEVKFYTKSNNSEILPVSTSPITLPNLNNTGYFWSAINGDYIIYAKAVDRADPTCFSISNDIILRVYNKPSLRIQNPITLKNCVGNSIFDLNQDASAITNAGPRINVRLEYYSSTNVLLSTSQITQYNADLFGKNPYLKVIYNISCSDTVNFDLSYFPKPASATSQILICSEKIYTLENFKNKASANPSNFTFTDVSGNPLPANFNLTNLPLPIKFYMKDQSTGCISDEQSITFVNGAISEINISKINYTLCDSNFDGKTEFNLDSQKNIFTADPSATFEYFKDINSLQPISAVFTNDKPFNQTVYARITIPGFCPIIGEIKLIVNTPTKSSQLLDKYFICFEETISIDGGSENTSWKWSTGETSQIVDFNKSGNYSVELTNDKGCSYTHNFIISEENQPKIEQINQTNNSIEVIANGGSKPYLYFFNGVSQSSNILLNPLQSSYEIQVQSSTGCLGPPKTIYFIRINNAFTPNADGINDVWKIDNLDKMQDVSILILDRNGAKVFESNTPNKTEWDGKNADRGLPSSTYWYVVSWFDPVTLKREQRQGWILLRNRN